MEILTPSTEIKDGKIARFFFRAALSLFFFGGGGGGGGGGICCFILFCPRFEVLSS